MYTRNKIQGCHGKSSIQHVKGSFHRKLNLNLRYKLEACSIHGAEMWTLREVDQKYLESFEMLCWRRIEKISWTDRVRDKEV
jgi:hypothetical protein